jgi:hypothetical protein
MWFKEASRDGKVKKITVLAHSIFRLSTGLATAALRE